MRRLTVLSFLLVLVACGEVTEPAAPEVSNLLAPAFYQGGQGGGAEFFANPFWGLVIIDADGVVCWARVDGPTDDINDFQRENPNGEQFAHANHKPSTVGILLTPTSDWMVGTGRISMNFHGQNFPVSGGENVAGVYRASAVVTDGINTAFAVCHVTVDAKGNLRQERIDLHWK